MSWKTPQISAPQNSPSSSFFPLLWSILCGLVSVIYLVDLCMILPFCHVEISFTFGYHFQFCPWILSTSNLSKASPSLDILAPILVPNSDSISSLMMEKRLDPSFIFWRVLHFFPGGITGKESTHNAGDVRDMGLIPGSGKSPGEGNGNSLQHSCLENLMDRRVWWTLCPQGSKESYMTEAT